MAAILDPYTKPSGAEGRCRSCSLLTNESHIRENMAGMSKRALLVTRIAVDLLLGATFLCSSVKEFYAPRFALPTYIYIGSAILGLLIAGVFIIDTARVTRRLRALSPKD